MKPTDLLNYDEAAALFKAASLPCSPRTVRREIWGNPHLCPLDNQNYHTKRVRRKHVEALIAHLLKCGKGRAKCSDTIRRQSRQP